MNAIFILHGWGSQARNWSKVKEILEARGFRVFVPDLPGFGENPLPEHPWSIDDYVEWSKRYIGKNINEPFFLVGHSFGGAAAIKYAIKYPQGLRKLFLVAASYRRRKTKKIILLTITAKCLKIFAFLPFYHLFRRAFYKFVVRRSDYPHATGILKESYLRIIQEDLSPMISSVAVPTVIIWGQKDRITPIENAYLLKDKIKNAELTIIEDGNHDLERKMPEVLAEKILNFIK